MSDERRWDRQATFDALAFGLDSPAIVLVPPDGDVRWREKCSICEETRAKCPSWEAHAVQRRRAYAERTGIPFEPWRCGGCGGPTGADGVQRDGVRYCSADHAQPYSTVVEYPDWVEESAAQLVVGSALYGGDR